MSVLERSDLLSELASGLRRLGVEVTMEADGLTGTREAIRAKWFLGGRKVSYRMSCQLIEAERAVRFREMVAERSWGLPPPTLTVETTVTRGWARSGTHTERSLGGGGTLDYAEVRGLVADKATAAGWRFVLEGGRMP